MHELKELIDRKSGIIVLLDMHNRIVATIYAAHTDTKNMVFCTNQETENIMDKYSIICNGIFIQFSSWQQISSKNNV